MKAHAEKTKGKVTAGAPFGLSDEIAARPRIGDDAFGVLTLEGSLNARNTVGGTAPAQVRAQVARHRARLG